MADSRRPASRQAGVRLAAACARLVRVVGELLHCAQAHAVCGALERRSSQLACRGHCPTEQQRVAAHGRGGPTVAVETAVVGAAVFPADAVAESTPSVGQHRVAPIFSCTPKHVLASPVTVPALHTSMASLLSIGGGLGGGGEGSGGDGGTGGDSQQSHVDPHRKLMAPSQLHCSLFLMSAHVCPTRSCGRSMHGGDGGTFGGGSEAVDWATRHHWRRQGGWHRGRRAGRGAHSVGVLDPNARALAEGAAALGHAVGIYAGPAKSLKMRQLLVGSDGR